MQRGSFGLSPSGLSRDQIDAILATRFPPGKPVSMAMFSMTYCNGEANYDPAPTIVRKLNKSILVSRIVPIPWILLPLQIISWPVYGIVSFGPPSD
jgi:hypothetical protein